MKGSYTVSFSFEDETTARNWFETARTNGCIDSDYGLRQATSEEMPDTSSKVHLLASTPEDSKSERHNWIVAPEASPETA